MKSIKEQVYELKTMDLDSLSKVPEKNSPIIVYLLTAGLGLVLGLLYWFHDDFIFSYKYIPPFVGFIIIFWISCVLFAICDIYYTGDLYGEYNQIIRDAKRRQRDLIRKEMRSSEVSYQCRKEWVESQIGTDELSQEDFEWHTEKVCWGCGKEHSTTPRAWIVTEEKRKYGKENAITRTTTIYRDHAVVYLCPDCYNRISKADEKNARIVGIMMKVLYYGIPLGVYIYGIIDGILFSDNWDWTGLLLLLLPTLLAFGLTVALGHYILPFIAVILALPFADHKGCKTKWDFHQIPNLRKIRKK